MFNSEIVFGVTWLEIVLSLHLLFVVVGAGSAFFSDFLFNLAMKDRRINNDEFRALKLCSMVVWVGLQGILLTGILIFLSDPDTYLHSAKFLSKMTIVAVLIVNGLIFDVTGVPVLKRNLNKNVADNKEFFDNSRSLFLGGAISAVSWSAAIILGSLRGVQAGYWTIIGIYLFVIAIALGLAELIHRKYLLS